MQKWSALAVQTRAAKALGYEVCKFLHLLPTLPTMMISWPPISGEIVAVLVSGLVRLLSTSIRYECDTDTYHLV